MKKLILLFVGALFIIASCSKDSGLYPGSDLSPVTSKGYSDHGNIIVLRPSGGDDTKALSDILNNAGSGAVIKLTEGKYHVGYIEVFGFHGTILGSGRNKTIISLFGLIDQNSQIERNIWPCWWRIIGGNVVVSDLTFKTGDGSLVLEPDSWYNKTMTSMMVVNNYNRDYNQDDPQFMNFLIKNVDFQCGYIDPADGYQGTDFNVLIPLWFGMDVWAPLGDIAPSKGKYEVVNCNFEHGFDGPEIFSFGPDAYGKIENCITDNCGWGIYCTANYGTKIDILNNTVKNSSILGALLEDNDFGLLGNIVPEKRSEYVVSGNYFSLLPATSGLTIKDNWEIAHPDIYKPILAIVKNNHFKMSDECTGISLQNNFGGLVSNNRFTGTGNIGTYVDGVMVYDLMGNELGTGESKNALIIGNNFSALNSETSDIYLGEHSSNCTIAGTVNESVINMGTNNKIIGMKWKSGGHFNPTIKDNFRVWKGRGH